MRWVIEKLSTEHQLMLNEFFCVESSEELKGCSARERRRIRKHSEEMEAFIKKEALEEQEKGLNTTHLLIDLDDNSILAYLSLCNDSIRLELEERSKMNLSYATIPAMKIARLAVSNAYKHRGIGKMLIHFAAYIGKKIREVCGLTFLTLDCYEHRISFYETIGFVRNQVQTVALAYDSPISMRMELDMYLEKMDEEI